MITDAMKFFERSQALNSGGATATATYPIDSVDSPSGGVSISNILSENKTSLWQSTTPDSVETITINLIRPVSIDRLILVRHNFQNFQIFASHKGDRVILSNLTDIYNEELNDGIVFNNSLDTSYFAFDETMVDEIKIVVTDTFGTQPNKFLQQAIITKEIGTFEGFPVVSSVNFSNNESNVKVKAGQSYVNKQLRTLANVSLDFKNYVKSEDIELASDLFERDQDFLFWASGGYKNFSYKINGFRLQDFFRVQTVGNFKNGYSNGSYNGVMLAQLILTESI